MGLTLNLVCCSCEWTQSLLAADGLPHGVPAARGRRWLCMWGGTGTRPPCSEADVPRVRMELPLASPGQQQTARQEPRAEAEVFTCYLCSGHYFLKRYQKYRNFEEENSIL